MNVSKLAKTHVVSFDIEDISIAWSQGGYPFLLNEELADTVLSGALEDCKDKLRDVMYKAIEDQLFKPK